jgi:hypothetical protein
VRLSSSKVFFPINFKTAFHYLRKILSKERVPILHWKLIIVKLNNKACLFLLFLLCASYRLVSQETDYAWWNSEHQWDGYTPWPYYLTYNPSFFGPNAFPCPDVKNGDLQNFSAELDVETHFANGEQTYNLFASLFIPLANDRVGLELSGVPIEYYRMDTIVRDLRASRDYDGKGMSVGDFYMGTWIKIISETEKRPNLLLSINLRTASGNNLDAARFSDAPGYFFDLSAGKTLHARSSFFDSLYIYAMAGFYAWQVVHERYRQDDALLYGAGISKRTGALDASIEVAGYYGYIGGGDKPVVARTSFQYQLTHRLKTNLRLEIGINDFPFTSVRAGTVWNLENVFKKEKNYPPDYSVDQ